MREAKVHTPSQGEPIREDVGPHSNLTRREFLVGAASVAAGLPRPASNGEKTATLPTVPLGPSRVTRLIVGGNPIYGYSHFNHLFSEHQRSWHTPERVVQLLKNCEVQGLNTWQSSYAERTLADLEQYRSAAARCSGSAWANPIGTSTLSSWMRFSNTSPSASRRMVLSANGCIGRTS